MVAPTVFRRGIGYRRKLLLRCFLKAKVFPGSALTPGGTSRRSPSSEVQLNWRPTTRPSSQLQPPSRWMVTIEIKEQEHDLGDDDLQVLAEIWPAPKAEAA